MKFFDKVKDLFSDEEEVVELFLSEIVKTLNVVDKTYEIIFINDGSKDNTMGKLINLKNPVVNFYKANKKMVLIILAVMLVLIIALISKTDASKNA